MITKQLHFVKKKKFINEKRKTYFNWNILHAKIMPVNIHANVKIKQRQLFSPGLLHFNRADNLS